MKQPGFNVLALGVGLACAALFGWLWRQGGSRPPGRAAPSNVVREIFPPLPPGTASAAIIDADTRMLLARLQRALSGSHARAREALLGFKDEAAMNRFLTRARAAGLTIVGQSALLRTVRASYENFTALQNELLEHANDYAALSANYLVNVPTVPAKEERAAVNQVPFGNDTLAFLGITGDHSQWGRGTTIAILDTGMAPDPTFGPGRVSVIDVGLGVAPGTGPEDGHGTAVAALAAGRSPDAAGVAPAASLLSIRVTDAAGTSDLFTLAQAIVAAVDAGARIINISLGGYATSAVLDSALGYASEKGAVVVAAAGNDQATHLTWPAAARSVVSVGAVDAAGQQVSFSNSGAQLRLTAPGYGVQTAWLDGQRADVDGTSASAPLVAGAIAAIMSQNPGITAPQATALLSRTANDGGPPGTDAAFGHGILNVGWAMNSGNSSYVDTAISTHYYDAANNQMEFVIQNRSGQPVTGMSLNVSAGNVVTNSAVPTLLPGESYVAKVPVRDAAVKETGRMVFKTELVNPPGLVDQVPANNQKSSVLTPPEKP